MPESESGRQLGKEEKGSSWDKAIENPGREKTFWEKLSRPYWFGVFFVLFGVGSAFFVPIISKALGGDESRGLMKGLGGPESWGLLTGIIIVQGVLMILGETIPQSIPGYLGKKLFEFYRSKFRT